MTDWNEFVRADDSAPDMPECCTTPGRKPCKSEFVVLRGVTYKRTIIVDEWCYGCGAPASSPHHVECDHDKCPRCGDQAICCDCISVRADKYLWG